MSGSEDEVVALRLEVAALQRELARSSGATLQPKVVAAIMGFPMVLWAIAPDGTITLSEGRGLKALGLEPGQLVGANVFELYAGNEEALSPIRESLNGQDGYSRVDIDEICFENRYFPRFDEGEVTGLFAISMDVTAQIRAEEERATADSKWRTLAANAPAFILMIDLDQKVEFINRTGHDYPNPRSIVGHSIYGFIHEDHIEAGRLAVESVLQGAESATFESSRVDRFGKRVWYDNRLAPLVEGGVITGVLWVAIDQTERRVAEEERQNLQAQILHAQKLESLGVLAGGIAHDFNNLLVSVMGHADLATAQLKRGQSAEAHIKEINVAARRSAELCQQMLAYAGGGHFELVAVDVSAMVDEISGLLSVSLPDEVALGTDLNRGLWPVKADAAQIQQILMNLTTNAYEAMSTRPGTVLLKTDCGYYSQEELDALGLIEPLVAGEFVLIQVTDEGHGMSPETATKMFDPFYTTKITGRGLGMASVLGIVRSHGGGLAVHTAPDQGTSIFVLLPRSEGEIPEIPLGLNEPSQVLSDATILVVDDEPTVRRVAREMLKIMDIKSLEASNGAEALEIYRAHPGEIAVVIMDLTMPVMGGIQASRKLAEMDPNACVLISSGYPEREGLPKVVRGILHKPYRLADLRKAIGKILDA